MFPDKRGAVENVPKWIVYFGIVIVVGIFMAVVVVGYQKEAWDGVHPLEVRVLSSVLRNNCLAVQDETKGYPGVIDPAKVNDAHLRACYAKESLGYRVTLQGLSGLSVARAEVLSGQQREYLPICHSVSASPYKCTIREEYVLYLQGKERLPGKLSIEVINHVE